ncbi:MAG: Tex-like N-terminal domain-containing protein, partial [Paludibacter sp.]
MPVENTSIPSKFISLISSALQLSDKQIRNAIQLFNEGATIPFISRYRKEMTEGMDEVQLGDTKDQYDKLCELAKRKLAVLKSIEEQGKLTGELTVRIDNCWDITELEDIYLPYKPKRRTKAEIAREKGLEPL